LKVFLPKKPSPRRANWERWPRETTKKKINWSERNATTRGNRDIREDVGEKTRLKNPEQGPVREGKEGGWSKPEKFAKKKGHWKELKIQKRDGNISTRSRGVMGESWTKKGSI